MKKKNFGNRLSTIAGYLRNFIRQIKIVEKGKYYVMNSKMRVVQVVPEHGYVGDGLMSNHITDFLYDEKFMNAYKEGKKTGALKNMADSIRSELYSGDIHYRAYIACYFAKYCSKLDGDFVECGVGKGLLSKTVVSYLNFAKINKNFFLFDTFEGIPIHQGKDCEIENMNFLNKIYYNDYSGKEGNYYNDICKTFSNYPNVKIIKGIIPESFKDISINKVSYLSIDMNNAFAEIEAIKFFWNKIINYGIILLDDYAYGEEFSEQKRSWDEFVKDKNHEILTLPTGQGLIIKN